MYSAGKLKTQLLLQISNKQESTNTGPRSATRCRNQFSQLKYIWLCSSVDKCLAVNLKYASLIPSPGDFFYFNFFLRGNEPNGEGQQEQLK